MSAVARILDDLKDRGGLQGKDIANITAVSTATVSRWSHGKATPSLRTQTVIAGVFRAWFCQVGHGPRGA